MNSNALTQYLDLYAAHRAAIDARAPEAFNRLRPAAAEALRAAGRLPRKGDEGYARTDIDALFAPDFGINIMRVRRRSMWPRRCAAMCPTSAPLWA